jgi:DNA-directed RNA polymerase specialized sigma24 family protein
MTPNGSVTGWIRRWQEGDERAFALLYERYHGLVETCARKRLGGARQRATDAEDIAQQALCELAALRASDKVVLNNRGDLLRLLTRILTCRAWNLLRGEGRHPTRGSGEHGLEALAVDNAATPDEESAQKDLIEQALNALPQERNLRRIGEMHLAGFKPGEIAKAVECVADTVTRKIRRIHLLWRIWAATLQPDALGADCTPVREILDAARSDTSPER